MAAIACGVQRRGGLRDMFSDDDDVADLAVTLAELVVRQTDRARVVGGVGLLQGAAVERNRPRLIAARRGQPPMQTPERGKAARGDGVAEGDRKSTRLNSSHSQISYAV